MFVLIISLPPPQLATLMPILAVLRSNCVHNGLGYVPHYVIFKIDLYTEITLHGKINIVKVLLKIAPKFLLFVLAKNLNETYVENNFFVF